MVWRWMDGAQKNTNYCTVSCNPEDGILIWGFGTGRQEHVLPHGKAEGGSSVVHTHFCLVDWCSTLLLVLQGYTEARSAGCDTMKVYKLHLSIEWYRVSGGTTRCHGARWCTRNQVLSSRLWCRTYGEPTYSLRGLAPSNFRAKRN